MKYITGTLISLFLSTQLFAQSYKPIDQGSTIGFTIKNLGINTKGSFSGIDGHISFSPAHPSEDSFDVSIDAASINTDNGMRDDHLKKESYFDVEKYPRIRMVSASITGGDNRQYTFNGKLMIKDKTKDISFPFTATPAGNDYIFKGSFTMNRRDFDVGGGSTISNSLTVYITVYASAVQ